MKKMKKIMALMLVAIMMMAMSVTAFAAEGATPAAAGANSLTVSVKSGAGVPTQTLKDQTIYLYKLFNVTESGTTGSKNYAYTVNTAAGYKDVLVAALNNSAITASSTDEDIANAAIWTRFLPSGHPPVPRKMPDRCHNHKTDCSQALSSHRSEG